MTRRTAAHTLGLALMESGARVVDRVLSSQVMVVPQFVIAELIDTGPVAVPSTHSTGKSARMHAVGSSLALPVESRDCVVRALAVAGDVPYATAYRIVELSGRKPSRRWYVGKAIAEWNKTGAKFRKIGMGRRTLQKFLRERPAGAFIVQVPGHALAVVDGVPSDNTKLTRRVIAAWKAVET